MKVILKDNVKYLPYRYKDESELENFVKSNIGEIFGVNTLFFEKTKIKSRAGIGSIPDGFVLAFDKDRWSIIEIELAQHPLYDHIVPQVTKFNAAIRNHESKKKLIDAFYDEINSDIQLQNKYKSFGVKKELYKVLSDLINKIPDIFIIIDAKTNEIEEESESFPFSTKILVFETYKSKASNEPIHIFDTLKDSAPSEMPAPKRGKFTKTKEKDLEFWTQFKNYVKSKNDKIRLRKPLAQHWYNISIGSSDAVVALTLNSMENFLGCSIYMRRNKELFKFLLSRKTEVQKELNEEPEWEEAKKASKIIIRKKVNSVFDQNEAESNFSWLLEKIVLFQKVFGKYIKEFKK